MNTHIAKRIVFVIAITILMSMSFCFAESSISKAERYEAGNETGIKFALPFDCDASNTAPKEDGEVYIARDPEAGEWTVLLVLNQNGTKCGKTERIEAIWNETENKGQKADKPELWYGGPAGIAALILAFGMIAAAIEMGNSAFRTLPEDQPGSTDKNIGSNLPIVAGAEKRGPEG